MDTKPEDAGITTAVEKTTMAIVVDMVTARDTTTGKDKDYIEPKKTATLLEHLP